MNVYFDMLGCRLNDAEILTWSRTFADHGHRTVTDPRDANVLVLNTCAVTGEAGRKSRQLVRRLHRDNPAAPIVVTGCYATLRPSGVAALPGVDVVVPNEDKDRLPERVLAELSVTTMPALATEPDGTHVFGTGRTRAFLKVQDGCRHRCTFCIVTVARGEERSRPVQALVDEVNALHAEGYQEVVLTGVHLGGYGADLGADLRSLVSRLLDETTIPRIRLSSLEPWDLPEGFFQLWRNPRLMPHLHLPLQSGCDATLKRMGRRCSVRAFRTLIDEARRRIPDLTVTTDVIMGFPGETETEWAESLATIRDVGFGHVHIFSYSARQGTAATRLPGHVPVSVKRARSRELHGIAAAMKAQRLHACVGTERDVLWERYDPDTGEVSGYTDNYLRVGWASPEGERLQNRIRAARLDRVIGDRIHATPLVSLTTR